MSEIFSKKNCFKSKTFVTLNSPSLCPQRPKALRKVPSGLKIWIRLFPESATKMKPPSSTATPLWWRTVDQELRLFFVAKIISPGELKLSLLGAFGTKGGQDFAIDVKDLDARNYIILWRLLSPPEVDDCSSRKRWHDLCCWRRCNVDAQAVRACCPSSQTWPRKCRRFGKPDEEKSWTYALVKIKAQRITITR